MSLSGKIFLLFSLQLNIDLLHTNLKKSSQLFWSPQTNIVFWESNLDTTIIRMQELRREIGTLWSDIHLDHSSSKPIFAMFFASQKWINQNLVQIRLVLAKLRRHETCRWRGKLSGGFHGRNCSFVSGGFRFWLDFYVYMKRLM